MDPLSAYRQKLDQQQKLKKQKKGNPVGLYVGIGAGALLLIVLLIWANSGTPSSPNTPTAPTEVYTSNVKLSEAERMALYATLIPRKEMVRPMGAIAQAYKNLADEFKVSVSDVYAVEREGNSKGWPHR